MISRRISRAGTRLSSTAPSKLRGICCGTARAEACHGSPRQTLVTDSEGALLADASAARASRGAPRSPLSVKHACYWRNMPQQGRGSESPSRGRARDPGGGRLLNRPPPRRRGRSHRILRLGSHCGPPAGPNGFRPPLTDLAQKRTWYRSAAQQRGDVPLRRCPATRGAVRGRGLASARRESLHPPTPPRELRSEHSFSRSRDVTGTVFRVVTRTMLASSPSASPGPRAGEGKCASILSE